METIQAQTYPVHFNQKGYNELANLIKEKNYSSIFILVDTQYTYRLLSKICS